MRSSLSNGQIFVHLLDKCREHLVSKDMETWESLYDSEVRQFILQAEKLYRHISDQIQLQREMESI